MPRPEKYVSRSDLGWGACPAAYADPKSGLVIHYDSSNQDLANRDHSACLDYWQRTRAFHKNGNGWACIGYSFMACPHSYILEGRGLFKAQAAQPGGNTSYYSVTLATGPTDEITDGQINAVRQLREWLMEPRSSIAGTVKGHRDFIATSCPGDRAYRMVRDGTFTKPATWGGAPAATWEDILIGVKKGDTGEAVEAVQEMVRLAGRGAALGKTGVDGRYGDGTAEGVRLCRQDVGSKALSGYGDSISGHGLAQLIAAVAQHQAKQHGGGGAVSLPATVRVSGELEVLR